jgi:hypothetical protein
MRFAHALLAGTAITAALSSFSAAAANLEYTTYADVAYLHSNRKPQDDGWNSKTSSATLNEPVLNLAMFNLAKAATTDSRWGFEFGLQAGEDTKGLVTSAPPEANEPLSNADELRHLYRANASYLFGADGGLKLTGGLINSYIGYESYLAIDNPNYTRAYLSDTVPYFLFGLEAMWDVNDAVDLGFYLVNGYNYLTDPNDIPSAGFLGKFKLTDNTTFIQNLYYGSDQKETDLEYWRFFTNSILEWKSNRWLFAGSLDYGTEKQGDLPGEPTHQWSTGAIWAQWSASRHLSLALRPEFHLDEDGIATGSPQRLQAYTATLKYDRTFRRNRFVGSVELRHDKVSGDGVGFGDANSPPEALKDNQTLIALALIWEFGN